MATRWATLVPHKRYRVAVTSVCETCDEIIEVHIPNVTGPAFTIQRAACAIVLTDRLGMTIGFHSLADALLAMGPLTRRAERELLKAAKPAWLPVVPPTVAEKAHGSWSIVRRFASRIAVVLDGLRPLKRHLV